MGLLKDVDKPGISVPDNRGAKDIAIAAPVLSRREFCKAAGASLLVAGWEFPLPRNGGKKPQAKKKERGETFDVAEIDRARILSAADNYLKEPPITITAFAANRSAGGKHDYYSESDYFWPDPENPYGPYIPVDGRTNPDNFVEHHHALMRLSLEVPALTAAWRITNQQVYATHAADHLRAWFVDPATRMNPNLQYAQAIRGVATGSSFGIIDTIHLVEVVRAIEMLKSSKALSNAEFDAINQWFADYLEWMTTNPHGIEERDSKNNHATCWVMQVAAFSSFTGNQELATYARQRYEAVLVPGQMALDGSFPAELKRTKPYCYSLFNLDAMATICQILSTSHNNLWTFDLPDGRGMRKAAAFMVPYIQNKKSWPLPPDIMYDRDWPMRQCSLLFAGLAFQHPDYIDLWKTLPADSTVPEVIRNFFIRQPVLWVQGNIQTA
jgi:hypothetical protein